MNEYVDIVENQRVITDFFYEVGFKFFSREFEKVIHYNKKLDIYVYVRDNHIYLYCIDNKKKITHKHLGNIMRTVFTKESLDGELKNFMRIKKIITLNSE